MEPTYIDRMEKFLEEQLNELTPLEAVLYLNLFHLQNKARLKNGGQLPEWFAVKNMTLTDIMCKDSQGIRRLKQSLKDKGLIDYQQGKKGTPTKYRLLDEAGKGVKIRGAKLPPKAGKGVKSTPLNYPLNYPLFEPGAVEPQGAADPLREEENKSIYPHTPKGGGNDLFQTFYKSYPKKKGKQAAERAFLKLKPDTDLFRQIMAALEAQKKSPDWQKEGGQYIPYPATWLNGRRWEDEIIPAPSQSPTREEQEARRRAKAEEEERYLERMQDNG